MVTSPTSGVTNSRGVTGGVYKARERIHRCADPRLLAIPTSCRRVRPTIRTETGFKRLACRHRLATRCTSHCSTCVAQVIRGMMI